MALYVQQKTLALGITCSYAGVLILNNSSLATLQRGMGYFWVFGQTASKTYFFSVLDACGNVVYNQSINSTTNMANVAQLAGLGSAVGISSGNAYGFAGSVSGAFMTWGLIPNNAGVPITSGGAVYGNGTLDLGSVAKGQLSPKDFASGNSHILRYYCPLSGPGGATVRAYGSVSAGSTLSVGVAATTSAAAAIGATSVSVTSLPAGIAPMQNVYDLTTSALIGSVSSVSGTTITLLQATTSAVGGGDTLLIGAIPSTIRAGQSIFDMTAGKQIGTVASWSTNTLEITLSQASPLNPVTSGNSLLIGGNTTATAAVSTSGGSVIPVAAIPDTIAVGQNIYDLSTSAAIGAVAAWDTVGLTVTISQANPANAIASGDTLSISGLNADPASVATPAPMSYPTNWAQRFMPLIGEPIQEAPWLSLRGEGEYYVWGVTPDATSAAVWFRGHYATSNGVTPSFEATLIRRNTRATFIDWTALSGVSTTPSSGSTVSVAGGYTTGNNATLIFSSPIPAGLPVGETITVAGFGVLTNGLDMSVLNGTWKVKSSTPSSVTFASSAAVCANIGTGSCSWSGFGLYQGCIPNVSAGVGFTRAIRYAGQSATTVHSHEKHGVGLVVFWHAQSQETSMFGVTSQSGSNLTPGGSTQVPPVDADDVFSCGLQSISGNISDIYGTNEADGDWWSCQAVHSGRYGYYYSSAFYNAVWADGITLFVNTLQSHANLPVMVVNCALAGHVQSSFYTDRQPVIAVPHAGDGWTPNGSTTSFTIAIQPSEASTWPAAGKTDPFGGTYAATYPLAYGTNGANSYPVVPGTFSGTIAGVSIHDDGAGHLLDAGGANVGTINYHGTYISSASATYPTITVNFASAPVSGSTYSFTWTPTLEYQATSAQLKQTLDFYGTVGVKDQPHTGALSSAYSALWVNNVTALVHMWWKANLAAAQWNGGTLDWTAFATSYQYYEGIRWLHLQWPNARFAKRFWAPPGRETPGGTTAGAVEAGGKHGGVAFSLYQYVAHALASGQADLGVLADCPDISVSTATSSPNVGQHEDFAGSMIYGQRFGHAVAAQLGYGGVNLYTGNNGQVTTGAGGRSAPVIGPVLASVTRTTSGGYAALVLTYDLPNGTALVTHNGGGIGTTIVGYELGTDASSQANAWKGRVTTGFTATITAANQVTLVHSTLAAWPGYVSLSYCSGYGVYTGGTATAYGNDNGPAGCGGMLCDNAGGYSWPIAANVSTWNCPQAPAGNSAVRTLDWAA